MEAPFYKKTLTIRSVQDRCSLLCEKHKKRTTYEKRATRISPKVTELDQLIEELIEKEEVSEEMRKDEIVYIKKSKNVFCQLDDAQKRKMEEDKENALDIRKKAMERMGETKKRKSNEDGDEEGKRKVRRRSGSDTLEFLLEQNMMEIAMKEKELEMKKQQQEKEEQKQDSLMKMMAQQQQQQQMQQMQMMMAQQNNLMLAMIEKLTSKQ